LEQELEQELEKHNPYSTVAMLVPFGFLQVCEVWEGDVDRISNDEFA
jgi:hypothetical protein